MQDRIARKFVASGRGNSPLEKAVAAKLVGDMDLLRLKVSARILARGMGPDIYWWDLLQEAFARVLNGTRHCPPDVPFEVFMTGVMRSIRAEYRRHQLQLQQALMRRGDVTHDVAPDPERNVLAQEELEMIGELFADDPIVTHIITGLGDGLSAEEIRAKYALTNTEYDSARKRMRRTLLRDGLRSPIP